MRNIIFLVVIVIIVAIGFYMFGGKNVEAPETIELETTEEVVSTEKNVEEQIFNIDGWNFTFSVEEIRVKEGDTVTINLTSTGGYHDWVVNEFSAGTERINEGETASVTFIADKKGEFEYYCSVGEHRAKGMIGKFIVE